MMGPTTIVPSRLRFKSAPTVDQSLQVSFDAKENELTEYDRVASVNLAVLFNEERQASTTFRPTFKVSPIYENAYTGTTEYIPFLYNLYYVDTQRSLLSGIWRGFPQYYEFEFFRPNIQDQHLTYVAKSAYTYFVCIAEHNLQIGDYVELSINYDGNRVFQVNTLGDGTFGSYLYIFNMTDVGYTGTTFVNNSKGTFKKIVDITNSGESKSTYYVKMHKIITNANDLVVTKTGFEEVPFTANKKFEFSSLTPNNISRISQKNASSVYTFTTNYDLNIENLLDNQKRPLNEIFLTIINKGYSGYFNKPTQGTGVKEGWQFNITERNNLYWDSNNLKSNSNIGYSSYTLTNGSTEDFYYNLDFKSGDTLCGDWCEWNNITQQERIISPYYQKIKYNQDIFKSEQVATTNPSGYYYQPHIGMVIRAFSNYVETGELRNADQVPFWAYYSNAYEQFMWRDVYEYGFIDEQDNGVDFPFLNFSHYPFNASQFRLIPDGGYDIGGVLTAGPKFGPISGFSINTTTVVTKPIVDECE